MSDSPAAKPGSLHSLQALRGIAACVVAFYHTHLILAQPEYGGNALFGAVVSRGWLGVNLFFILSGFIIVYAHRNDIGRPQTIPSYVTKRLIRLYPVYWIFMTAYILAAIAGLGHPDFELSFGNLVSAFLLVKFVEPLTLPLRVAWTLFYELIFYAMFVLFLINRKIALGVFAVWTAAILVSVVVFDDRSMGLLNVWNLYFPLGMVGYWCYRRFSPATGPFILAAGLLLLAVCAATQFGDRANLTDNVPGALLAFAVPCCMIIVGATLSENYFGWRNNRVLALLGEASYSIYLVHSAVISLIAIFYVDFLSRIFSPPVFFFVTAIASILCGTIAHKLVEVPVLRVLRSAFLAPRKSAPEGKFVAGKSTPVFGDGGGPQS